MVISHQNLAGESESESEAGESEVKWTITMKVVSIFVLNIFALRDILYIELDIEYQACWPHFSLSTGADLPEQSSCCHQLLR